MNFKRMVTGKQRNVYIMFTQNFKRQKKAYKNQEKALLNNAQLSRSADEYLIRFFFSEAFPVLH